MEVLGLADELGTGENARVPEYCYVDTGKKQQQQHRIRRCSTNSVPEKSAMPAQPTHKGRSASSMPAFPGSRKQGAHRFVGQRTDVQWLQPEAHEGNMEYKLKLMPQPGRVPHLITQMHYRLAEGGGECVYIVGVEDNGYPCGLPPHELSHSLRVLHALVDRVGACIALQRTRAGVHGQWAEVHIRRLASASPHVAGSYPRQHICTASDAAADSFGRNDMRIVVAGASDSGKSTLVSVLTRGIRDNGRGSARLEVLKHKHEVETGRTSSLSHQSLGYDTDGRVVHHDALMSAQPHSASRVLTFVDLAGRQRYLKTALFGLTCMAPDYALLTVSAQQGIINMTKEHLAALFGTKVPMLAVLTKVDLMTTCSIRETAVELQQLLSSALQTAGLCADRQDGAPLDAYAPVVSSTRKAAKLARRWLKRKVGASSPTALSRSNSVAKHNERERHTPLPGWVPIVPVSASTGEGLETLHTFLQELKPLSTSVTSLSAEAPEEEERNAEVRFHVESTIVPSDGTCVVVAGIVSKGTLYSGQKLLLGPSPDGEFETVHIQTIRRSGTQHSVSSVPSGTTCTLALTQSRVSEPHEEDTQKTSEEASHPPMTKKEKSCSSARDYDVNGHSSGFIMIDELEADEDDDLASAKEVSEADLFGEDKSNHQYIKSKRSKNSSEQANQMLNCVGTSSEHWQKRHKSKKSEHNKGQNLTVNKSAAGVPVAWTAVASNWEEWNCDMLTERSGAARGKRDLDEMDPVNADRRPERTAVLESEQAKHEPLTASSIIGAHHCGFFLSLPPSYV